MHRHLAPLAALLLVACSEPGKGLGAGDFDTALGDDLTDFPTGDTDDTETTNLTDTAPTWTDPTDTEPLCANPPLGGTAPTLAACEYVPSPTGTLFAAKVEWSMANEMIDPATGAVIPAYHFAEFDGYGSVYQAPAVRQITDDNLDGRIDNEDIPDIAVIMAHPDDPMDAVLRLISGDGSRVHDSIHWATHTNAKGTHEYAPYRYAGVAIADIDGDGKIEIATLVTRRSDNLCWPAYYQVNQVGSTVTLTLERVYGGANYNCGGHAPAIADLDGDGVLELIYGKAVFRPDFSQKWYGDYGRGWYGRVDYPHPLGYWNSGYHSFAHDMDGDGRLEVLAGRTVYKHDGSVYCHLGQYEGGVWVDAVDGYPAVGDLLRFPGDTVGEPEIVITGNSHVSVYHGVPDYDPYGQPRCLLIDQLPNNPELDPTVPAGLPAHPDCDVGAAVDSTGQPIAHFGGPATIADFDGDGNREIAVAGGCWYSVYDFDASRKLRRFALAQTRDWSSASTGSTVFDFNGDGRSEVVFSDEEALYVWGVDPTGSRPWDRLVPYLIHDEHKSWTVHEYPLVADVDRDGKAEIVVVNSHRPDWYDRYGIYVLGAADDDWVSARNIWHQHAYYITNVEDNGDVGVCEPNYAPYTPEDYNSFRLQAPGSFGVKAAPNLFATASTCQETCGDLTVWVQVTNEGAYIAASPDVVVALYGVTASGNRTLLDSQTLGLFLPGGRTSDAYEFHVSGWSAYARLEAVVDDPVVSGVAVDGVAKECDETDNVTVISLAGLCP